MRETGLHLQDKIIDNSASVFESRDRSRPVPTFENTCLSKITQQLSPPSPVVPHNEGPRMGLLPWLVYALQGIPHRHG